MLSAIKNLPKIYHAAIIILLAISVMAWLNHSHTVNSKRNQEIGKSVERDTQSQKTIKNVEKANVAVEAINRNPDAAFLECLRNARNPSDC